MRSYGQYCGLARSLEVVGDRWNLLIVRQLLIAPARYRDLIDGLPGIATNQPIESLIRWSTPLMVRGPEGDSFRVEWLALAVPALLDARVKVRPSATVGLEMGNETFQLLATSSGFEIGPHDGRELDATVRADPSYVLGLAAGALTLSDARTLGLIEIDGDESVVRAVFTA